MIDGGEADDKIIGVLDNDNVWGQARNIGDVPAVFIERLQHYFLTYKLIPGQKPRAQIRSVYGKAHAARVIRAAMSDYADHFSADP
jgi:inorganic pyrophosphatase